MFYMSWNYRFGALIFISTVIDYYLAIRITETDSKKQKKTFLYISVFLNLVCILGFFKYYNFFSENINLFLSLFGFKSPFPLLHIVLPVGISFFTFQSLSYTIDVYREIIPCERSFIRFSLFVSFFPQLVAGPIVTAKSFLPQLFEKVEFQDIQFRVAIRYFFLGYFKKVILSDNAAPIVDLIFRSPENYGTTASWIAAILFSIQIYCDFSGYSDMAYGSALLLGYRLPENFRLPFISRSITEFWGLRWHLSLSIWIRDYVYIPLGGSRVSYFRHKFNLWLTMFLSGIWHGANWTFVIWGSVQGFLVVIESLFNEFKKKKFGNRTFPSYRFFFIPHIIVSFFFMAIINTWFRAENIQKEFIMLKNMLVWREAGLRPYMVNTALLVLLTVGLGHILGYKIFEQKKEWKIPAALEFFGYIIFVFVFAALTNDKELPFVYFQF